MRLLLVFLLLLALLTTFADGAAAAAAANAAAAAAAAAFLAVLLAQLSCDRHTRLAYAYSQWPCVSLLLHALKQSLYMAGSRHLPAPLCVEALLDHVLLVVQPTSPDDERT